MKSILKIYVRRKKYFFVPVRHYIGSRWFHEHVFENEDYQLEELKIDEENLDHGHIEPAYYKLPEEIVSITNEFNRELNKGEVVNVYGKNYTIEKVSHAVNGEIIYYLDYVKTIEDKESLKLAEEKKRQRKEFLENYSKLKEKEEKQKVLDAEISQIEITKPKKKWYQFWLD
jgi:hypothetical protein